MDDVEELRRVAAEGQIRLFTAESLAPIHQLNNQLVTALIDEASEAPPTARSPAAQIGDLLVRATAAARAHLAEVPVCLVDAGFRLDERWSDVARGEIRQTDRAESPFLRRPRAMRLAYQTFDAAAAAARASHEHAVLTFGMTPAVARVFSGMSGEAILKLRKHCAHWIAPRWCMDLSEWERLIAAAQHASDEGVIPAAKYRAMARLYWDMEPSATRVASEIRRSRR
jgi:hypothetical protein